MLELKSKPHNLEEEEDLFLAVQTNGEMTSQIFLA